MRGNTSEQALVDAREHERRRVPERAAARMMTHIDVRKWMRGNTSEQRCKNGRCNRSCGATVPERYSGSPA